MVNRLDGLNGLSVSLGDVITPSPPPLTFTPLSPVSALAFVWRSARPLFRTLGVRQRRDMAGLAAVADVQIDPDGVFKYILVRVSKKGGPEHKDIVRGTKTAEFHNNIFEKLAPEMEKLELECKCLGGGKIDHNSKEKKIRVFGVSTVSTVSRISWLASHLHPPSVLHQLIHFLCAGWLQSCLVEP
ncbi:sex-regulated protein janus-A isoform X2 [Rhincodon typus]|uniref:sex-regulated protein janus-A isoform X2 n=1 Tax=Rhincodon typus TaxID=259920 RepID=UPI00202FFB21|nr:sex-regulated protein janus-A isoform X2 [Rhincodon typus]